VSISPLSGAAADQAVAETERQIAVMKKEQDVKKDEAEALVDLIKQAAPMPEHVGTQLNVLA